MFDDEQDDYFDENERSKSQLKRDSTALQELGKELLTLNKAQLAKIELDENLERAIHEWHRLKANEAKRRQLQYIGKLMRQVDNPDPIAQAVAVFKNKHNEQTRFFHHVEFWRDKLIADGDSALNDFIEKCPKADRNLFRQLIRQAQKEVEAQQAGKGFKQLFREIRLQMENHLG